VTRVENKSKRHHDRREGSDGQSHVGGFEREAEVAPHAFGEKSARLLFARLVGKPVLIMQ
jgi:hypothetical protein